MGGERIPGVMGTDPAPLEGNGVGAGLPRSAGFSFPGPIGTDLPDPTGPDPGSPLAAGDRIITSVTKDWDPPSPTTTPDIVVNGKTLQDAANDLNKLAEWGQGGGILRTDPVPVGTSPTVTVAAHANLVLRMPKWTGYATASAAARAEWDQMIAKLQIHEQRHVDIAIEEADNMVKALMGKEIGKIPGIVTAANKTLKKRQDDLDTTTQNGSKPKVQYGDVSLDTSIT